MTDGVPTLVVVSGPAGAYGKTTLAHKLARAIGCPAICRDEIKEGMVHANPGFEAGPGDVLTQRTLPTFFSVLETLLRAGSSVVAEAAFHDDLWTPGLNPLAAMSKIRVIRCVADREAAGARDVLRHSEKRVRKAHSALTIGRRDGSFTPISMDVPKLLVDTTEGYDPSFPEIVNFVNDGVEQ